MSVDQLLRIRPKGSATVINVTKIADVINQGTEGLRVQVTVKDGEGADVTGVAWPVEAYTISGGFQAVIPATIETVVGESYVVLSKIVPVVGEPTTIRNDAICEAYAGE